MYLIDRLIKKDNIIKMIYYPNPNSYRINKIKVELDLPNYATKSA